MRPRSVVALLSILLSACAVEDAEGESETPDQASGSADDGLETPSGAAECYERYFSKLSFDCATIDCGEALTCEIEWDCLTCADRCAALTCSSDADCEAGYGDLCDDVEWRCEPYITSDNLRCSAHDPGESRCGDDVCSSDESCEDCKDDCGYCPGTAPTMAPCDSDSDCESGWCDDWCVGSCSSGWDCVGDGTGTLFGDCVMANDNNWYCFPNCTVDGGCAAYPGTSCVTLPNVEEFDVEVCSA